MIDHEFLILHGVRKSDFLETQVFSGITALTAFNRNANGVNGVPCRYKGVNGVPCRYKGVNGVLLVGKKALTAFCLQANGVTGVYATISEK